MNSIKIKNTEIQSFDDYFIINDKANKKYKLQILMSIVLYIFALVTVYFVAIAWYFILLGVVAIFQFIVLKRKDVSQKIEKKNIRHILVEKNMFDKKIVSILHPKKRILGAFNKEETEDILSFFNE